MDRGRAHWFWTKARDIAGTVAVARIRDLQPDHAAHAVVDGKSLHIAGRLLGHRRRRYYKQLGSSRRRDPERLWSESRSRLGEIYKQDNAMPNEAGR